MDINIEKAKKVATILSCLLTENDIYCESCEDTHTCNILAQALLSVRTEQDCLKKVC
jgi:hypothetical protein